MNHEIDQQDEDLIDLGSACDETKGSLPIGAPDEAGGAKFGSGGMSRD